MKKLKENKGITLVALIITIIVLLILAVVTISAVNEGSLFSHANNAVTGYSKSQEEENTMISNWLVELAKHDKSQNSIVDKNEIVGTYYSVDGNEMFNIEINQDNTLNFIGSTGEYQYLNGKVIANIYDEDFIFDFRILENGAKTLYIEKSFACPKLYANDLSKLNNGTIKGKYEKDDHNAFLDFSDENNEVTTGYYDHPDNYNTYTYTYFTDFNVILINNEYWYKIENGILYELGDNEIGYAYTKQN